VYKETPQASQCWPPLPDIRGGGAGDTGNLPPKQAGSEVKPLKKRDILHQNHCALLFCGGVWLISLEAAGEP
jgi:hypothetical protein